MPTDNQPTPSRRRLIAYSLIAIFAVATAAQAAPPALTTVPTITSAGITTADARFTNVTMEYPGGQGKYDLRAGKAVFNGQTDDTFCICYNLADVAGQPEFSLSFESNYDNGPTNLLEWHLNYGSIDGTVDYRPFNWAIDLATHEAGWHNIVDTFWLGNRDREDLFQVDVGTDSTGSDGTIRSFYTYRHQRNDQPVITARNAADSADLELLRADASNRMVLGQGVTEVRTAAFANFTGRLNAVADNFRVTAQGIIEKWDDGEGYARTRIGDGFVWSEIASGMGMGFGTAALTTNGAVIGLDSDEAGEFVIATGSAGTMTERLSVTSTEFQVSVPLQLDSIATGDCASSAHAGKLQYVAGGAGAADTLKMCMKTAADAYGWQTIHTAT